MNVTVTGIWRLFGDTFCVFQKDVVFRKDAYLSG